MLEGSESLTDTADTADTGIKDNNNQKVRANLLRSFSVVLFLLPNEEVGK